MIPGVIISGTHSGVGKTTITLGIMSLLVNEGYTVQGYKVGPDYIDPSFYQGITGRPGENLDGWMTSPAAIKRIYQEGSQGAQLAVVEGVMGLFDGAKGDCEIGSTAEVAKILGLPVILVIDARSMARSVAALIKGFCEFDPELQFGGIIFNRVGSEKHRQILIDATKSVTDIHILGFIGKDTSLSFPERHLGLAPFYENQDFQAQLNRFGDLFGQRINLDALLSIFKDKQLQKDDLLNSPSIPVQWENQAIKRSRNEGPPIPTLPQGRDTKKNLPGTPRSPAEHLCTLLKTSKHRFLGQVKHGVQDDSDNISKKYRFLRQVQHANAAGARGVPANTSLETPLLEEGMGEVEPQNCLKKLHEKSLVKIGIARDQAFGFYYQDNLRLLQQAGAELVFFSPLKDQKLPLDLDGLYIGGGYPELFAERLSSNNTFREALKTAIGNGLPTYAECGGLMYLAKQLRTSAIDYPMVAVLKIEVEMTPQREALGYIEAQALMDTLLLKKGQVARGHEFHYSKITETWEKPGAYSLKKSDGTKVEREGFSSNDLLASYVHLHFASNPGIADRFIARCRTYKSDVKKIKMFNCAPSP